MTCNNVISHLQTEGEVPEGFSALAYVTCSNNVISHLETEGEVAEGFSALAFVRCINVINHFQTDAEVAERGFSLGPQRVADETPSTVLTYYLFCTRGTGFCRTR